MKLSSPVITSIDLLQEVRDRTLTLIADLDDEQLIGPRLSIVNPLRWETGHVTWFQEDWVLRHLNDRAPILDGGDALYVIPSRTGDEEIALPALEFSPINEHAHRH